MDCLKYFHFDRLQKNLANHGFMVRVSINAARQLWDLMEDRNPYEFAYIRLVSVSEALHKRYNKILSMLYHCEIRANNEPCEGYGDCCMSIKEVEQLYRDYDKVDNEIHEFGERIYHEFLLNCQNFIITVEQKLRF